MAAIALGGNVDSWCTKCKLVLAHTIESIVEGKITKVHCNTCGGRHAYRPHAPGQGPKKRRATNVAESADPAQDYRNLLRDRDPKAARTYTTADRFRPSELIQHPVFGLGVVKADRDQRKIEVLFADGPRILVHGRAA